MVDNYCGAHYYRSLIGHFSSPYYPNSYPINMACYWFIEPTLGNRIVLNIESIDIENSENCNHDYLEIRETDTNHLLGVFCGNEPISSIESATSLTILFSSDANNVVGNGFLASYNYGKYSRRFSYFFFICIYCLFISLFIYVFLFLFNDYLHLYLFISLFIY